MRERLPARGLMAAKSCGASGTKITVRGSLLRWRLLVVVILFFVWLLSLCFGRTAEGPGRRRKYKRTHANKNTWLWEEGVIYIEMNYTFFFFFFW